MNFGQKLWAIAIGITAGGGLGSVIASIAVVLLGSAQSDAGGVLVGTTIGAITGLIAGVATACTGRWPGQLPPSAGFKTLESKIDALGDDLEDLQRQLEAGREN